MIPKIIHYCWFGEHEPGLDVKTCIESWMKNLPDYKFILWNEENFNLNINKYVRQAYDSHKYAFVSDFVRLYALYTLGGIYLDTDVMVFKSFDPLLNNPAFAGYEGSKRLPIGTCVIASEAGGDWVKTMYEAYYERAFILHDGSLDQTTNVTYITDIMIRNGLVCDGKEQDFMGLHIYPVEYFSPRRTTGEYIVTENTYSDHLGLCSWGNEKKKPLILKIAGPKLSIYLIKLKRLIIG